MLLVLERIIEKEAATIKMANNNIIINDFVIMMPPNSAISFGKAGSKNFLVAKTAIIE